VTKIYVALRVPCEHGGRLAEPLGAALTEAEAVAMCSTPYDSVVELDAGRLYPPGETIEGGVRTLLPHCPNLKGWQTAKGLASVG
jgi:hypothetical protein